MLLTCETIVLSLAANTKCPLPINTVAIADAGSLRLSFKFISHFSALLYLRCFTSSAKNMVEFVDILDL